MVAAWALGGAGQAHAGEPLQLAGEEEDIGTRPPAVFPAAEASEVTTTEADDRDRDDDLRKPPRQGDLTLAGEPPLDWAVLHGGFRPHLGTFGGIATFAIAHARVERFYGAFSLSAIRNDAGDHFGAAQIAIGRNLAHRFGGVAQIGLAENRARTFAGAGQWSIGYNRSIDYYGVFQAAGYNRNHDAQVLAQVGAYNFTSGRSIAPIALGAFNWTEGDQWSVLQVGGF
ncbi:MAG: hypothetical protein AAGA56_13945, partial [Myxococcota bacterium]